MYAYLIYHYSWQSPKTCMEASIITIAFIILLNLHVWNYYAPSRTYVREPPFNNFDSTSSESTFPSHPRSQFPFLTFCEQENRTRGKAQIPSAHSAPQPSYSRNIANPHLPLISRQVNIYAAPCHSACPRAAGGRFPLRFTKSFLHALTLFFLRYWRGPYRSFHPLESVKW